MYVRFNFNEYITDSKEFIMSESVELDIDIVMNFSFQ